MFALRATRLAIDLDIIILESFTASPPLCAAARSNLAGCFLNC